MRSPVPDYLDEVLTACPAVDGSEVADYIPELARADPSRAAIALATVDGSVYRAGDGDLRFSIQSMSKPFTYALALIDRGLGGVAEKVDVEPSGEAFNEISLEPDTGRPRNPMINAGAIATHGLIEGADETERSQRLLEFYGRLAGRDLDINQAVYDAEIETAHRNLALGHLLKSAGIIDGDPVEVVRGYVRQCAVSVDVADLAMMAATLSNGGVQPRTGERVLEPSVVRQVLSVMATCGMYDAAGDWLSSVGIPAKSGVSGGIIGVLPGQVGLAVFSPPLDAHGNSARGVAMMQRISRDMNMHLMSAARPARSAIRGVHVEDDVTTYELQGDLVFVSAESLLAELVESPPETSRVVFDFRRVAGISDVARRMTEEAVRRLRLDGLDVESIEGDPENM